jgi:predicted phage-related endonuclease
MRKRTGHIGMSQEEREARRSSLGGSDARIIMSGDPKAIERLWMEKRGEVEPENLDDIIIVQMGNITEDFNIDLFEIYTGLVVTDEQNKVFHPEMDFLHTTLDGKVRETADSDPIAVLEAKFMMPFHFSPEKAVEKYFPQVQHNMMVTGLENSWLSILTGSAQHIRLPVEADIFYQTLMLEELKKFWDCVQTGRRPDACEVKVNLVPMDEMVIADMSASNEWGDLAATLLAAKPHADKFDKAEKEIRKLMPADAKEATARGVTIKRSTDNKLRVTLDKKAIEVAQKEAADRAEILGKAA